jgi:hypothetical protein
LGNTLTGIVVCDHEGRRRGFDKGLAVYHDKPQQYHVYEMLQGLCSAAFLCCDTAQAVGIDNGYCYITYKENFMDSGLIAAALTALKCFPESDIMIVSCEYPFLNRETLRGFSEMVRGLQRPAAFYDVSAKSYVPLLGYYPSGSEIQLMKCSEDPDCSLQQFLRKNRSLRFVPGDPRCLVQVYDEETAARARAQILNAII